MKQKRFYKNATIESCLDKNSNAGFRILLDGRKLSTPQRNEFVLQNEALANLIADEWNDQGEFLNPNRMPVTRLLNVVVDKAADTRQAMINEVKKYAASDLICYRVSGPDGIAKVQHELWQPVIDWIKDTHNLEFVTFTDSFTVGQKPDTLESFGDIVGNLDDLQLTSLTLLTDVMGSAILAFAFINRVIDAETAFKAIRIEEDYQASIWGADDEDLEKSAHKRNDIFALEKMFDALK